MARSRISEVQVVDADFVSHEEHSDPAEVPHYLTMNIDFPSTYSGTAGRVLVVNGDEAGLDIVESSSLQVSTGEYPRYYIEQNIDISINNYGQYVIEEVGYLEVEGSITLNTGSMVIVK